MSAGRITTIVVAVACLVTASVVAQDTGIAGPKLEVPEKILDLGTVAKGDVVEANFKLVNEGSESLVVKSVRPTCGCTVADYDREIAAGGSGWVKAKLDTGDFSGPVSKSILVMTNDPQDPTVSLVIKAEVKPYVEVLPRPLIRFNALAHEQLSQKVTIVSGDGERNFKVKGVDSNVPYVKASVRQLPEEEWIPVRPGPQYEVALSLADDAPMGPVNAQLSVHTDHPKAPTVPIKVYGVVRALLHVTPPQIQFGTIEASSNPGRNVIVINNRTGGEAVKVTSAEVTDSAFDATVSAIEEGRRYQVTVTVKPDADPGTRDALLKLSTTDPEFAELTVPVRANIR
jgi:hypothetical protein